MQKNAGAGKLLFAFCRYLTISIEKTDQRRAWSGMAAAPGKPAFGTGSYVLRCPLF